MTASTAIWVFGLLGLLVGLHAGFTWGRVGPTTPEEDSRVPPEDNEGAGDRSDLTALRYENMRLRVALLDARMVLRRFAHTSISGDDRLLAQAHAEDIGNTLLDLQREE